MESQLRDEGTWPRLFASNRFLARNAQVARGFSVRWALLAVLARRRGLHRFVSVVVEFLLSSSACIGAADSVLESRAA